MDEMGLLLEMANGNLGAMTFVIETHKRGSKKGQAGLLRLYCCGIKGSRLYMLWNDCCGRNFEMVEMVMLEASLKDIKAHINYENGRGLPFTWDELEDKL